MINQLTKWIVQAFGLGFYVECLEFGRYPWAKNWAEVIERLECYKCKQGMQVYKGYHLIASRVGA